MKDANAAMTRLEKLPEKNLGFKRDPNPGPLRYRCNALPKPHESWPNPDTTALVWL